jgi:hypothetical protein
MATTLMLILMLGFGAWGLRFKVLGLEFGLCGLWFMVYGLWFVVWNCFLGVCIFVGGWWNYLDALLHHLLAERDCEGVHCGCGRGQVLQQRRKAWFAVVLMLATHAQHSHTDTRICTFGGAVDGDRGQGHEGKARGDVEAARREMHTIKQQIQGKSVAHCSSQRR